MSLLGRKGRWWLIGVVAVGAVTALMLRQSPVRVEVAIVGEGPLTVSIDAEGQTRVRDRYTVSAGVAGRLLRPAVRAGDRVRAGDVVAWLDPAPLDARAAAQARARIAAAEDAERVTQAGVVAAKAAVEQAQHFLVRAESLAAAGLLSPEDREKAELAEVTRAREFEAADFRAQAAGHDVETARAGLLAATQPGRATRLPVRTPISGQVLRVMEESERVVLAGAPILEVGDPRRLEVVADLLSADAVQVRPGDSVLIEAWGGQAALAGRLRSVEPSGFTKVSALGVEEQRVNVIIDLLDPPERFGDRFRVEVQILIWQSPRVTKVPVSALVRQGSAWAVFAVRGGRGRLMPVAVGHRGAAEVELLSGLASGATVIVHPSDRISDGVRIQP